MPASIADCDSTHVCRQGTCAPGESTRRSVQGTGGGPPRGTQRGAAEGYADGAAAAADAGSFGGTGGWAGEARFGQVQEVGSRVVSMLRNACSCYGYFTTNGTMVGSQYHIFVFKGLKDVEYSRTTERNLIYLLRICYTCLSIERIFFNISFVY